ncbi:Pescadillo like protein [Chelonia mydas]|uniref:Pescadillo like protein n=1 Tax=Chelonia mydas TaxID=8469 RepID=M7B4B5_CHEMY|nr:Pescadillo like protein [Chelonia mydas]
MGAGVLGGGSQEGEVRLEDKQRAAQEEQSEKKHLAFMMMKKREKYLYQKIMFGKKRKVREATRLTEIDGDRLQGPPGQRDQSPGKRHHGAGTRRALAGRDKGYSTATWLSSGPFRVMASAPSVLIGSRRAKL